MPAVQAPALIGASGLLERAVGYARLGLSGVTAADLARGTPCHEWDLRALLEHLSDSLAALCEAAAVGRVELRPSAEPGSDTEIVTAIRQQASALLGAWTGRAAAGPVSVAGCPLPAAVLAATGALEIAVHGWDIAQACLRTLPLPPLLAEELLELVPLLITGADRPVRFAAPVDVPASASPAQRLLAAVGRRPSGVTGADPG
jgi:uncharacterized protein (TIGR03086 family)